ncbi:UNVERIFIED_CONTAM: Mitogen-activated protein kinase [Sesamum radiatum]|uniref:Mitogen-activated protein kinase n=1 Tax=Sesamum radiatum TaxID=300843 RepID=A0AAW2T5P6_SESRA
MSDAIRILREIKLLRLLRHPDIVEIKRIMLPPSRRDFKDIYVVFELMESDLHQVIKANDDLTHEHHRFFLYQMLRALKYMHTGLCCYKMYRAPELCGSFFSKYTPAIDIWSIGCIFAEVLTGKPLFPGKSVVHQLDLITDLLGTPSADTIAGVRNEKARKYLTEMRRKRPVPFAEKFLNADPLALKLLQRLLAFDPKDRPSAEEALADPYFKGLAKIEREPSCQPISKLEFEFERRRVTKEDIRELIFREILEYHPQLLKDYMAGTGGTSFLYPSAIGHFKKQFAYLEENVGKSGPVIPPERKHVSLPRSTINSCTIPPKTQPNVSAVDNRQITGEMSAAKPGRVVGPVLPYENVRSLRDSHDGRVYIQNSLIPQSISPHCFYRANSGKNEEKFRMESGIEASQVKQPPKQFIPVKSINGMTIEIDCKAQHQYTPSKLSPGMSFDINSNPYYQSPAKAGMLNSQIAIDAKLMQAQSQFVAAGAAAHREVGAIQLGLT